MYAKLENNKLIYAPKNLKIGDKLILNFNKNVELMQQYGYKEVVDVKPSYDINVHYLSISGYIEEEDRIAINYKLNEIVINDEPTLENRISELEKTIREQMELINQLKLQKGVLDGNSLQKPANW